MKRFFLLVLLSLAALIAAGCDSAPALPEVSTAELEPRVAETVEAAVARAREMPESAALSGRVGMVLHAHGQLDEAIAWYQRAQALDAGDWGWPYYEAMADLSQDKTGPALKPLQAAMKLEAYGPGRLAEAQLLFDAGKATEACAIYDELSGKRAFAAPGWFGKGRCRAAEGDSKAAIEAFGNAIEAYPPYGPAWQAMGEEMQKSGQEEEAKRALERAAMIPGQQPPVIDVRLDALARLLVTPEAFMSHAEALAAQGRVPEAASALERAAELDPESAQPWVALIALYGQVGEVQAAEQAYLKAVEVEPKNVEAHRNYGVLLMRAEKTAEAKKAFERALEIDPEHVDSRMTYALALEASGDASGARKQLDQVIEKQPEFREARFHAGRIAMDQRRFKDAIGYLEKTLEPVDEQTPQYLFALASAQAASGDMETARATVGRARTLAEEQGQMGLVAEIDARMGGEGQ